jgi:hypothetical protein
MSAATNDIRENIREAALKLKKDFRFVGEIACPNCDKTAWEIDIAGRGVTTICPQCGFGLAEA